METETKEHWKIIEELKAFEVSDLGNVRRRLPGKPCGWGRKQRKGNTEVGHVLTPSANNSKGYLRVCLRENGKSVSRSVHRLVAEAFIPNPKGLPQVNHKGEKLDNRSCMLEWISQEDHGRDIQKREQYGDGVSFVKASKSKKRPWMSRWCPKVGVREYIGHFATYEEAKAARDEKVKGL